jgi:hypothetical protein
MPSNPDGYDRVLPVKQEWTDLGGGSEADFPYNLPANVVEDGIEIAAIFIQEVGRRNKALALWSDNGDLRFRDVTNPGTGGAGYTLTEMLAGSSGITEGQHEVLDTLVHKLAEDSHVQVTRSGGKVSNITVWTNDTETTKIREFQITRTSGKVSQIIVIQYDNTGAEDYRLTKTINRVSGKVDSVDVVRTDV